MESSMKAVAAFKSSFAAATALFLFACAAPPPPPIADLTGTDWRVVSVNGRATPNNDYSMRFGAGGAFGAKLGCNSMGGEYRLTGGTLVVKDLNQTLIGCPEPSATFEQEGSAILRQPMQVAFTSNERMSLSNAAGSIALDPMR
jgi:heat shock protein HslJ